MKKTILILLFLFLLSGLARSDVLFVTKRGQSFTWFTYTEEGDRYCTWKTVGRFCIPKSDVESITVVRKKKFTREPDYSTPEQNAHAKSVVGAEKKDKEGPEAMKIESASRIEKKEDSGPDSRGADAEILKKQEEAFRKAVEKEYKQRYYPEEYYSH